MTATETIIEDAMKGGWNHKLLRNGHYSPFIDPTFWQAVGKTRGWGVLSCKRCGNNAEHSVEWLEQEDEKEFEEYVFPWKECECGQGNFDYRKGVNKNWQTFVGHLADGLTIEEALAKLTP